MVAMMNITNMHNDTPYRSNASRTAFVVVSACARITSLPPCYLGFLPGHFLRFLLAFPLLVFMFFFLAAALLFGMVDFFP